MNSLKEITEVLNSNTIALVGVSENPKKFGNIVYHTLLNQKRNVIPVNPNHDSIGNNKCYRNIKEINPKPDSVIIITPKEISLSAAEEALEIGVKNIWINQGSNSPELSEFVENKFENIVNNKCIFMFSEPVEGIHKFHKKIVKIFGKYPK